MRTKIISSMFLVMLLTSSLLSINASADDSVIDSTIGKILNNPPEINQFEGHSEGKVGQTTRWILDFTDKDDDEID